MLDSRSWPAAERDRFLSHLKTPWVLKDPRMIDIWDFWLRPIERQFGKPLVIWSIRDPQWIRESFNAAGWTGAPWERRLERAKAIYQAYDGPKPIIEHERLTEAMKLFDPGASRKASRNVSAPRRVGRSRLGIRSREAPPVVGLAPPRNAEAFRRADASSELGDGWAPLCRYLGAPVPDRPYPPANKSPEPTSPAK